MAFKRGGSCQDDTPHSSQDAPWHVNLEEQDHSRDRTVSSWVEPDLGKQTYPWHRETLESRIDPFLPFVYPGETSRLPSQYLSELEEIRMEKMQLQQSQRALRAELTELKETMGKLMGSVQHPESPRQPVKARLLDTVVLPEHRPPPPARSGPPKYLPPPPPPEELEGEENDWPDPPSMARN